MFNKETERYMDKLLQVESAINNISSNIRPKGTSDHPGGVVRLDRSIPTIIVPDLHARRYFIDALLSYRADGVSILNLLESKSVQIVCVGDGFHAERRAKDRWMEATKEFKNNFNTHSYMDTEMSESLGLMEKVIDLKVEFPEHFFFLKGNHENILNEDGDGNYPFGKFTSEGIMVKEWVLKFYGPEFLYRYARFEKMLPLLAIGRNFLVSHAEPNNFYGFNDIVNYHNNPEVIYGLTWTRDDQATKGSVQDMLDCYIDGDNRDGSFYFSGHRTISSLYNLRAGGELVQIHNPDSCNVIFIPREGNINLEHSILTILDSGVNNE